MEICWKFLDQIFKLIYFANCSAMMFPLLFYFCELSVNWKWFARLSCYFELAQLHTSELLNCKFYRAFKVIQQKAQGMKVLIVFEFSNWNAFAWHRFWTVPLKIFLTNLHNLQFTQFSYSEHIIFVVVKLYVFEYNLTRWCEVMYVERGDINWVKLKSNKEIISNCMFFLFQIYYNSQTRYFPIFQSNLHIEK